MAGHKIKAKHRLYEQMLEKRNAAACKAAADTIRAAEEHVLRSEEIVSQSMAIVERATKTLDGLGWSRRQRQTHEDGQGNARGPDQAQQKDKQG